MFDSEKAKKRLENITGLPITSDKKEGRKRVFTSTVNVNSKGVYGQKEISFGDSEKRRKEEELRDKEVKEKNSEKSKEWKTYSHFEKWTEPEGNIDVEVKTVATGDFDFEQFEDDNSAEITELMEEEVRELEGKGIKVEKPSRDSQKNGENETSSKSKSKLVNKTPFISGLIVVSLVGLGGVISVFSASRKG